MDTNINKFIETLDIQTAIYKEFLELAGQKKQVLIDNDIQKLNEITNKEVQLVKRAKQAEDARQFEASKAAEALGIKEQGVTLLDIAQALDGQPKRRLLEAKEALGRAISELTDLNNINKELVNTHIDYTNFSMEIMTQSAVSAETYSGNGYVKEDKNTRIGLIDQKV